MNLPLELTLHGALVWLIVCGLEILSARRMSARTRRLWWLAVPPAFLVSFPLRVPLSGMRDALDRVTEILPHAGAVSTWASPAPPPAFEEALRPAPASSQVWFGLWLAGVAACLLVTTLQTGAALRRWSRERLCTRSALLDLLEDAKRDANVTAPIGLVVTDRIGAPAILGWLRPRLLLPASLAVSLPPARMRAVLLHELAHFRYGDVPLNWLFTLVRAVHWFNPAAHLACRSWDRFREEAADEAALAWMNEAAEENYAPALLEAVRQANGLPAPCGALGVGESLSDLKQRLFMIHHHHTPRPHRYLLAGFLAIVLLAACVVRPARADGAFDDKPAAVAAMQTWLHEIDAGRYAQSWTDASAFFQKALTSDKWVQALTSVRTPLGKCTARTLASTLHQTEAPAPGGTIKGDFYVAQFNASFENLAYAVETVCFEKTPDGDWKASGYYIKPRT